MKFFRVSRCFTISRRAEKSVKEFFCYRYRFRMKIFRVFCVFCGSTLSRVNECKGVFRFGFRFRAKFIIRI